jgi:hypothetical protein
LLFDIRDVTPDNFEALALQLFRYQYDNVPVYKRYVDLLGVDIASVKRLGDIPFLPISFFKSHEVLANGLTAEAEFYSSTTTGAIPSKHFVPDIDLYRLSSVEGFRKVYGDVKDWSFLALLPSYLERGNSSLVWMVSEFMLQSQHGNNGFYLNDFNKLTQAVLANEEVNQKTLVIGVGYALLDWADTWNYQSVLKHTVLMETGGMKGRRKEMVKEELHQTLQRTFIVDAIHSEYGMTELLSQAYSTGKEVYRCPNWMKVIVREINDPFNLLASNETGSINVVDLANQYSCSFIATDDLGRVHSDGTFSVLGRLDSSEMRGCNLLVG